jgi:hypothetical protein
LFLVTTLLPLRDNPENEEEEESDDVIVIVFIFARARSKAKKIRLSRESNCARVVLF